MSSEPPKPGAIPGWGQPADAVPDRAGAATGRARARGSRRAGPDGLGPGRRPLPSPPHRRLLPRPAGDSRPRGLPRPRRPPAPEPPAAPPPQAPAPQAPVQQAPPPGWGAAPAAVPPGQVPAGGGTPPWNPAPAKSSGNGCLKACLIVGAILVVLFFIAVAGLVFLGNQIIKSVPVDEQGNLQACPFVSNEQLSSVLGSGTKAVPLTGFFDATIGIVLDKRVLPDAEDCWITADGATGTGRIARYQGSDAGAKFQAEKQAAQPTSQDQGNGLTLENAGLLRRRRLGRRRRGVLHRLLDRADGRRPRAQGRHAGVRQPPGARTARRPRASRRSRSRRRSSTRRAASRTVARPVGNPGPRGSVSRWPAVARPRRRRGCRTGGPATTRSACAGRRPPRGGPPRSPGRRPPAAARHRRG